MSAPTLGAPALGFVTESDSGKTAAVEWPVWTTTARVVVTEASALGAAHDLVRRHLDAVDLAASRFRPDSEVSRLAAAGGGHHRVSPLLAELVQVALAAAAETDGAVDPTLGAHLAALGYDGPPTGDGQPAYRFGAGPTTSPALTARRVTRATWRDVVLDGLDLTTPEGVVLDLGATAKAYTADVCAAAIAEHLGCGALVSLGGDLSTAGPPPAEGWSVMVQDGDDEPASHIDLTGAQAVATSSTLHRTWSHGPARAHHLIDPATFLPAPAVWRTVTVAAQTCLAANTLTTAAMIRGEAGLDLLIEAGVAARLVRADGRIVLLGGWPA